MWCLLWCALSSTFSISLAIPFNTLFFADSVAGEYTPWNLGFDGVVPLRCDAMGGSTEGRRTGARDVPRADGSKVVWNTSLGSGTPPCGPLHGMA